MWRKQRRNICITNRRITVLTVSDSMSAIVVILGAAERWILRAHRDVLPAVAHWLG